MKIPLLECLQLLQNSDRATIVYDHGDYQPEIYIRKYNKSIYVCEWDGFPIEELSLLNYDRMYCVEVKQLPRYTCTHLSHIKTWHDNGGEIAWEQHDNEYIDIVKDTQLPLELWMSDRLAIKNY